MRRMLMGACDGGISSQAGGKQCGTKEECKKKVRQVVMQLDQTMAASPEELRNDVHDVVRPFPLVFQRASRLVRLQLDAASLRASLTTSAGGGRSGG